MDTENLICKICGNRLENNPYRAREMMFGIRDEFDYFECSICGCLQINAIPEDVSKYYPAEYYSFSVGGKSSLNKPTNKLITYLRHQRTAYFLNKKGLAGGLISLINPVRKPLSEYLGWLKRCNADFHTAILDVGCGRGQFLLDLAWYGFKNLTGLDLYIHSDFFYKNGVRVFKNELSVIDAKFDILIFNHSLEHMPKPALIFSQISRLMNKNGCVIIRTPTTSSYAWRNYGVNWVQVDAPRHFFIHSLKSIELMAGKNSLRIKEIVYDSSDFQFIGSEQYRQNIPLKSERSYYVNPKKSIFKGCDIRRFREKAVELNSCGQGDQVCIYLIKN